MKNTTANTLARKGLKGQTISRKRLAKQLCLTEKTVLGALRRAQRNGMIEYSISGSRVTLHPTYLAKITL